MKKAKFGLLAKEINLDQIEGKYSAFAKVHYALPVKMSKPLAKDGYGTVTVDGIPISEGKSFTMNVMVEIHCLLIPVGEVAREYGKEYAVTLTDFTAEDGSLFPTQTFKFRTLPRGQKDPAYEKHDEVALRAAREGMVLLKNEGNVLPLVPETILNCFGSAQFMFRNSPTGASLIHPRWQADFHQAIKEYSHFRVNETISSLYGKLQDVIPSEECMQAAKEVSDVAVILISRTSGEFLDNKPIKGGYYLTDEEEQMIKAVSKTFEKTIAIINTGYPIDMRWTKENKIDAILYTGFAGMGAGYALVEILDGRTNPSGKLPDTWTYDYYDNPSSKNFINFSEEDDVPSEKDNGVHLYYEEDIYVGYRYFDTFRKETAYCFGFGLGYTDFTIETEEVEISDQGARLVAVVTNVGKCAGKEIVQVYVHAPDGALEKPNRVLVAFEKTKDLQPGESERLKFSIKKMDFVSYDETIGSYILEKGNYEIYCGNSLDHAMKIAEFDIRETETLRKVNRVNLPVEEFHRMSKEKPYVQEDSKLVPLDQKIKVPAKRATYLPKVFVSHRGKRITFLDVEKKHELLGAFVSQMTDEELCALNVCGGANWYMPWQDGTAGKNNIIRKYKIPRMKVSDGNSGLNIKKNNIGFPSSTTVAATFNKQLAYEIGQVIGEESKENGIAVNLGPGMNIHRNILNGRHPEYYSEDPYLTGVMAGHQGKGLEDSGVGCTYKHLFCNNSDTSRKGSHSIVSERALREIYFRTFEIAMEIQKPSCLMTSYNCVNGIYPAENPEILQTLVREEWGFKGLIMTDWGTYDTVDPVEMAKAGNCWLTEGSKKCKKDLLQGVKDGRLSRAALQHNVAYLIALLIKVSSK